MRAHIFVAHLLCRLHEWSEALGIHATSLQALRDVDGNTVMVRDAVHSHAQALHKSRKYEEAAAAFQDVAQMHQTCGNVTHSEQCMRLAMSATQRVLQSFKQSTQAMRSDPGAEQPDEVAVNASQPEAVPSNKPAVTSTRSARARGSRKPCSKAVTLGEGSAMVQAVEAVAAIQ